VLDLRHEAAFAAGHLLFAANMAADRIPPEAQARLLRKGVLVVVYDGDEGIVSQAAGRFDTAWSTSSRATARTGFL
jgi:hypothetical protein